MTTFSFTFHSWLALPNFVSCCRTLVPFQHNNDWVQKNCIFGNVNLSKTKWSTMVYYENWVCRCLPTPYKVKRNTHLCFFRYFRKMFFWNLNFEFCTFFLQKRPNWSSSYILLLTKRRISVKCKTATFRLFFEQFPKKTFGNVFRKTVSFSFRSGFSESIILVNDHFSECWL